MANNTLSFSNACEALASLERGELNNYPHSAAPGKALQIMVSISLCRTGLVQGAAQRMISLTLFCIWGAEIQRHEVTSPGHSAGLLVPRSLLDSIFSSSLSQRKRRPEPSFWLALSFLVGPSYHSQGDDPQAPVTGILQRFCLIKAGFDSHCW